MIIRKAILCLFFGVTTLACGVIQAKQEYFRLDSQELKFIYSMDQIHISQPDQLDFLFLSGFGMKYLEWKQLFLDEIEADHYEGYEFDDPDCAEEECRPFELGRFFLFGRYTEDLAKQQPVDGNR